MAACKSLHHMFENPLPENQAVKPVDQTDNSSSFSELFGELNSKHNSLPLPYNQYQFCTFDSTQISTNKNDVGFPLLNKSESLQLCTEGLGSESSDDVEDFHDNILIKEEKLASSSVKRNWRSGTIREACPPPLSFVGRSGKSGVFFKSFRQNGRFVLKEVRIPTQEFLQAHREDGRLKLQIVQPDDEDEDEDEDEEVHDVEEESELNEEENDVSNVSNNGQALSFIV